MYARIAVNVPGLTGEFDYHLPDELAGRVGAGYLVTVPFGKQTVQGVVLELIAEPSVAETKPVLDLLDPLPALTSSQIALAHWLSGETLSSLAACIGLMLPSGLSQQADSLFEIGNRGPGNVKNGRSSSVHGQVSNRLVELLETRGPLRGRQIDRHFKNVDWRKTAQYLVRTGVLTSKSILPPPSVRPKFVRTAQLAIPLEQAEMNLPGLGKTAVTLLRRQAALRFLMREPSDVNVAWVYAESGCNLADLQDLADRGLVVLRETEIWRDPLVRMEKRGMETIPPPKLTPDQQVVWEKILQAFKPSDLHTPAFLLHGVTGSGKTEIYIRAAQECVRCGKEVIILVPEIALTPQTVHRFLARFPGQVGLLHSRLSEGERYDTWRRARSGQLKVIIGPRSALFAPLPNIGLIVADECHDSSYYQSEPPFYNAVSVAMEYARICGGVCILGSATPSVVQSYQASSLVEPHLVRSIRLNLPKRIVNPKMPSIQVLDMREELKSGNRGIFSRALVDGLKDVLKKGQQAILFLNRRGTSTYVFCRECGTAVHCPRCDTPLTYHIIPASGALVKPENATITHGTLLVCHRCGYSRQMPEKCSVCGSNQIRQYGLGSEKVEAEVTRLFPSTRTLRWDWETTRQKDAHEIILSHFTAHRADVLIGTQMLAKGLDLPLVTLVGIVLADVGLNLPDPFAAERTFDILTQVSGRAGRSSLGGRVVLQTFQPEHYVIQAAAGHDYSAFYVRELEYRKELGYPPFNRLVRMEYRHAQAAKAETEAHSLAQKINQLLSADDRRQTTLIGPAPCFFSRLAGLYRWQIILRGPDPVSLLRGKNFKDWRVEVDPISLL